MAPSGGPGGLSFSDRFFSYETFKVLRVRDRRLGGLYRLFQATILVYIASSIIIQQRYLKTENVINGAVRVTLKAPADGIATPDYCKSTPPECLYWSENDILYEPGVDGALITTRTQITQYGPFVNQTLGANPGQSEAHSECDVNIATIPGCDPYKAPSTLLLPSSLVADIERFTLMLEHSIRGQATGVQIRSGNMESGILRDAATGQALRTFTDESRYVPATTRPGANTKSSNATVSSGDGNRIHLAGDVMTVGEFLKAAGVNLDELSGSPTASTNETVRSSGVVVIVVIQYAAKGWNPNRISYEYLPKAIPDQEYKVIETIRDFKGGSRVEINRHGIRIVFSQTGQLGQFSLMTLLTNLVAAVALFKVANIIVELMMLRLHPQKKVYKGAKFEHTKGSTLQRNNRNTAGKASTTPASTELNQDLNARSDQMEQGVANLRALDPKVLQGGPSRIQTPDTDTGEEENDSGDYQERDRDDVRERHYDPETDSDSSEDSSDGRNCIFRATAGIATVDRQNVSDIGERSCRNLSIQTGQTFLNAGMAGHSKPTLTCRPRTPISNNGTLGQSQRTMDKRRSYPAQVDWNRNGSSSALNGDVLPGVANVITRSRIGTARVTGGDGEDMEIETRYGPVHLHGRSSFNPGGLSLSGTLPLTQMELTPPRSRTPFNLSLDMSTPEYQQVTMSPSYTCQASPASMQAVSPSPVYFGPDSISPRPTVSSVGSPRLKSREDQKHDVTSNSGTMLPARRTSSSSVSLSSSSSGSSLSSLLDSPASRAKGSPGRISDPRSSGTRPFPKVGKTRQKKLRAQTATSHQSARKSSPHFNGPNSFSTVTEERRLDKGKAAAIIDSIDTWPKSAARSSEEVSATSRSTTLPSFLSPLSAFPVMDDSFLLSAGSTSSSPTTKATPISNSTVPTADIAQTKIEINGSSVHTILQPPYSSASVIRSESVATVLAQDQMPHSSCGDCHQRSPGRSELFRSHSEESLEVSCTSSSSSVHPRRSSMSIESAHHRRFSVADHTARRHHINIESSLSSSAMPASTGDVDFQTSSTVPRPTDLLPSHAPHEFDPAQTETTIHSFDMAESGDIDGPTSTIEQFSTIGLAETGCYTSDFLQHPTSAFFSSLITSACTTTLPGSGIRVLGRSIRMVTEDNTELVLCRSEPLILNEGVGEEKAARM